MKKAFKVETNHMEFSAAAWVVKEYKPCALEVISEKQSVEAHTKKVVQMRSLAQNFAKQWKYEVTQAGSQESF